MLLDMAENLLDCARNNATIFDVAILVIPFHCVGLSRASLTVREDAEVIAIDQAYQQWFNITKHVALSVVWLEYTVELEIVASTIRGVPQFYFPVIAEPD